jgi:hypothetical protein
MEPAIAPDRPTGSSRTASCLWCHEVATHADLMRNHGLCPSCVHDNVELSWRVVYDRDRKIGAVPPNLRLAYRL